MTGAADLLRAAGLLADGPVLWGRPIKSNRPGVYVVELPAPHPTAPLDIARVGKWLERATDLLVDGVRPTSKALAARLAIGWIPGQTVLFVGSAGGPLAARVAALQATQAGDPLPFGDGLRLHLLRGLETCRVWWAETDAPEEYEDALLDAFAAGVDPAAAIGLGGFVAPFAVLRRPTGEARPDGITGAFLPAPVDPPRPGSRVVLLPPAPAARQVAARAPRAVARAGRPAPGSVPVRHLAAADVSAARAVEAGGQLEAGGQPADASPSGSPGSVSAAEQLHISREGLARLEAELQELRAERRPEIVRRVAAARELGDLRENSEYHAAREELGFLDGRAQALEARLRTAIAVDAPDAGGGTTRSAIGSIVVVETDGAEHALQLVGASEANAAAGRISVASPVGRALVGRVAGDVVTVATPSGPIAYHVLRVE